MTVKTGSVPTIAAGTTTTLSASLATYRDFLKAESEAWTSYTPVWTAVTVNPAIGNGTIVGAYMQSGKKVITRVVITMGTTTTYGTGTWLVTLPATPSAGHVVNSNVGGGGSCLDFSAAIAPPCSVNRYNAGDARVYFGGASALVAAAAPFTWANGDILSFTVAYEAA